MEDITVTMEAEGNYPYSKGKFWVIGRLYNEFIFSHPSIEDETIQTLNHRMCRCVDGHPEFIRKSQYYEDLLIIFPEILFE